MCWCHAPTPPPLRPPIPSNRLPSPRLSSTVYVSDAALSTHKERLQINKRTANIIVKKLIYRIKLIKLGYFPYFFITWVKQDVFRVTLNLKPHKLNNFSPEYVITAYSTYILLMKKLLVINPKRRIGASR